MRLLSASVQGITVFDQPASVPFSELGPGLIALVGRCGQGKTTLLEALPIGLWQRLPNRAKRKSVYDYMPGESATVELEFANDVEQIRVRSVFNRDRRKAEAWAWVDGEPKVDGKITSFAAFVEGRFGSPELFLASIFAAQNRRGALLDLERAERKQLFFELLRLGRYERLQEVTRTARQREAEETKAARIRIETLTTQAEGLDRARDSQKTAEISVAEAGTALAEVEQILETAEAAAAEHAERRREVEAAIATERAGLDRARADLKFARLDHDRAKNLITAALDEERRSIALLDRAGVDKLEQAAVDLHRDTSHRLGARRRQIEDQLAAAGDPATIEQDLEAKRNERHELGQEIEGRRALRQQLLDAQREERSAREALERARQERGRSIDRLTVAAQMMTQAPCAKSERWGAADRLGTEDLAGTCPLLEQARNAAVQLRREQDESSRAYRSDEEATHANRSAELETLTGEVVALGPDPEAGEHDVAIHRLQQELANARAAVGRRGELDTIEQELQELGQRLEQEVEAARHGVQRDRLERGQIVGARKAAVAGAEEAIAAVVERLQAADKQEGEISARLDRLQHDLGQLELADASVVDVARQRAKVAQAFLNRERENLAVATERVQRLEALAAELSTLVEQHVQASLVVEDLVVLEEAVGPNGAPALLVDAAGPEVASHVNELLATPWGGRFSIRFDTLRQLVSGEFSEDFVIKVFDAGRERDAEDLSGGERAVLSEAIGLGVARFNADRSGIRWDTLVRDETAGALDAKSAIEYVAMLRRARQLGEFHQLLFVTHSREVWEAADERVWFHGGRVHVGGERPPEGWL